MPRSLALTLSLLLLAGCGSAPDLPPSGLPVGLEAQSKAHIRRVVRDVVRRAFDRLDRSQDDVLTPDELRRTRVNGQGFAELDKNQNGQLTFSEFAPTAAIEALVGTWREAITAAFGSADGDGNRKLAREEWVRKWPLSFNEADLNDNGHVTYPEYEKAVLEHSTNLPPSTNPMPIVKPGRPPAPPAPPPEPAPAPEPPPADAPIS